MKTLLMTLMMSLSFSGLADLLDIVESMDDLSVVELSNGEKVLAGPEGLSVYTFDIDDEGVSNCFGQCLVTWPALATDKEELPEPFSIHIRPDGTKQIVLDGEPLYYFIGDESPGDISGDNLGGVWHIITL